jgi:hypothetical protein
MRRLRLLLAACTLAVVAVACNPVGATGPKSYECTGIPPMGTSNAC